MTASEPGAERIDCNSLQWSGRLFGSHLDEHDAEQEPGEHLAEDDEEQGLGGRQPAEAHAQIPAVVQAQGQQLQPTAPTLLWTATRVCRALRPS